MKTLYRREEHFRGGDTVKDIVIGMSDGMTVPFALAAGISVAISAAHIVVTAGFAEIAAGSIAMGLGGYLAARSEVEHYRSELAREETEIREKPEVEAEEVAEFFRQYGLTDQEYGPVVAGLRTKAPGKCPTSSRLNTSGTRRGWRARTHSSNSPNSICRTDE